MILNLNGVADFIANFINQQAEAAGAESLVVGVSGGVDSALVLALCNRAADLRKVTPNKGKLKVIGVMMPCHSSPASEQRAKEVLAKFGVPFHRVDLADSFDRITINKHTVTLLRPEIKADGISYTVADEDATGFADTPADKFAMQSLRSCLRAPTLDYFSKLYKGIIVGTGNRDEDEITRYFQKRGDGCVDISPIAKLHKSEVYELSAHLGVPESILKAVPSADLMGPDAGHEDEKELGMTYNEMETAVRLTENYLKEKFSKGVTGTYVISGVGGGFISQSMPESIRAEHLRETAQNGGIASPRMLKVLLTLADMEEKSRHKENPNLPVCNPRKQNGFFI